MFLKFSCFTINYFALAMLVVHFSKRFAGYFAPMVAVIEENSYLVVVAQLQLCLVFGAHAEKSR